MSEYLLITTANREHAERIARAEEHALVRALRRVNRNRRRAERQTRPGRRHRVLSPLSHRPGTGHA